MSAAEAFLLARFRMYAWAIHHHKIQQATAGLRIAIGDLLGDGDAKVQTSSQEKPRPKMAMGVSAGTIVPALTVGITASATYTPPPRDRLRDLLA